MRKLPPRLKPRTLIVVAGILALLALVPTAEAWRRPTASERSAITAVAERTPHSGRSKVHVSDIKVSTVGPWAFAAVTIYVDGESDGAGDVLHRVRGHWRLTKHSPGTEGIWCGIGMPRADQRNLGFGSCAAQPDRVTAPRGWR